jgi:hypothetical protein
MKWKIFFHSPELWHISRNVCPPPKKKAIHNNNCSTLGRAKKAYTGVEEKGERESRKIIL